MSPVVRVIIDVLSVGLAKLLSRPAKKGERVEVRDLPPKQRAQRAHAEWNAKRDGVKLPKDKL